MHSNPAILSFEGVAFEVIDRLGQRWMTQTDLARALYGIKGGGQDGPSPDGAVRQIRRLFDRNKDEFTDEMTALLTMETAGGPQQVRIYSPRGCYLMAMFAKTALAKRFRQWVLDVLEGHARTRRSGGRIEPDELRELKVKTAAINAATRSVGELRRTAGPRAAARAAPAIYANAGVTVDISDAPTLAQGELELTPPSDDSAAGQRDNLT